MADIWGISGRSIVVVGAGGGGIGTAVCRRLAGAGASVVAVDRDAEKLALATEATEAEGGSHLSIVADATDRDAMTEVVDRAAALAPLHGSVQVAGGIWPPQWAPFASDDAAFDDVIDLNFGATVTSTRAVGRRLVEQGQGGSVVHIATVAALNAMPYASAYAAAKAAVLSLTRSLAVEWGRAGIRVNAVAPGSIATPKSASTRAPGDTGDDDAEVIPLRRRGTSDDIADAVLYLSSGLASYVTGQVLAVDGGSSVKPSVNDRDEIPIFVHNAELRARLTGRPQA